VGECLSTEKTQDQGEYDADENACHQGEVEGEILSLDDEISREFAKKWNSRPYCQEYTYRDKYNANKDQNLSSRCHIQLKV
jgi:hypothetical protein